jgi:hypothetical protein
MAKVIRQFREISHNDHIYNEGDSYPAEGFEADAERVSFLSEKHPSYGFAFLFKEEERSKVDDVLSTEEEPSKTDDVPKKKSPKKK